MASIVVDNISKKFNLGKDPVYFTLRDKIIDFVKNPLRSLKRGKKFFWALRDVNFKIEKGEVVGLIGQNGSGKSTLLKIISKIISPTEGQVTIKGKVVSLLEVGTGFHPELTGRENIFLNGSIYKMSRAEMKNKFEEIVEFSGISKFLDTPIKHYSNGMYVRLAFAVASHVYSDILLIDEVLSVGDHEFQKKCLLKIKEIIKNEGRTIMLVSHNLEIIKSICSKTVLLEDGSVVKMGKTNKIIQCYLQSFSDKRKSIEYTFENAPGNEILRVRHLKVFFDNDKNYATITDPVTVECNFWSLNNDNRNINLSLVIYSADYCLLNSISPVVDLKKGEYSFKCRIPGDLLNDGQYFVKIIFSKNYSEIFSLEEKCNFELKDKRSIEWNGPWIGAVRPKLNWAAEKLK